MSKDAIVGAARPQCSCTVSVSAMTYSRGVAQRCHDDTGVRAWSVHGTVYAYRDPSVVRDILSKYIRYSTVTHRAQSVYPHIMTM